MMKTILLYCACCLILLCAPPSMLSAQPFVEVTAISDSLAGAFYGKVAWGDYDNDGDLDLLVVGGDSNFIAGANIYRNDSGVFSNIQAGLLGRQYADAVWGDFDNDGDLDLVMIGSRTGGGQISTLYRNDAGAFVDNGNSTFAHTSSGAVAPADYDADGDLDILICGSAGSSSQSTQIYRNDGQGAFTIAPLPYSYATNSKGTWADYDNDGDQDLLLSSQLSAQILPIKLYRNDDSTFTDTFTLLDSLCYAPMAWGDCDNDGDLDLLISCRSTPSNSRPRIFLNDNGIFTDMNANLPALHASFAAWGDYDNDGDLDILLLIQTHITTQTLVFANDGNRFTDIEGGFPGMQYATAAWGDYDNDGDLDIVIGGISDLGIRKTVVYRNDLLSGPFIANMPPDPITDLSVTILGDTAAAFTWSRGTDSLTPSYGLSYHLWIGTANDNYLVSAPLADTATGWRRIAAIGDIQVNRWTLKGFTLGETYFACVSAIDGGFMGSPCTDKISFLAITAVTDPKKVLHVKAWPNPTTDALQLTLPDDIRKPIQYQLVDAQGKSLPSYAGNFVGKLNLSLRDLPAGVYFLQLNAKGLIQGAQVTVIKQ